MKLLSLLVAYPAAVLASLSYKLNTTLPWIPQNSTSVDISIAANGTYYLSDRRNGIVHVIDLATSKETARISGFTGLNYINGSIDKPTSGPNGLLLIPGRNELYVGDAGGKVKVVDLRNLSIVDTIQLPVKKRADEMTFDATRQLVAVTGPDDDLPQLVFINVTDRKIAGTIAFPLATNGIEKPAWNPADGMIYQSVPETDANPGGEIDIVDPSTFKITKILPTPECSSHGIAFGPGNQLLLGCSQDSLLAFNVAHALIMDFTTGKITSTISGIGGTDTVQYDPNTNLYYLASFQNLAGGSKTGAPDPKLGIVDAGTGALIQTIATDNVTAQSVAVDTKTNKLIVPLAGKGIAIFDLVNSTAASTATGTATAGASASASTTAKSGAVREGVVSIVVLVGVAFVAGFVLG